MIFVFSGTGNSYAAAKRISEAVGTGMTDIAAAVRYRRYTYDAKGEPVGFVFPTYYYGLPRMVLEFVRNVTVLNPGRVFAVTTCGEESGGACEMLVEELGGRLGVDASYDVVMPDNSVFAFDPPTKEQAEETLRSADAEIDAIIDSIRRDDPRDVILPCPLSDLPEGATVGTASVRRESILREVRPDLKVETLRGNIHTRLARLDAGDFDAIILAKAGLDRMGIDRPMHVLDERVFVPAPAQGIIAVECRKDDEPTRRALSRLECRASRVEAGVERGIMKLMGAGCSSPVGINARIVEDSIHVEAVSYTYTEEPRRVSRDLPMDYVMDELLDIAEYLTGRRDSV